MGKKKNVIIWVKIIFYSLTMLQFVRALGALSIFMHLPYLLVVVILCNVLVSHPV